MNDKLKILVVEDDPSLLQGLLDVLVFNGYEVTGIDDGKKGLETFHSGIFDLVMLDVMLPGMDGFEICSEIRKAKENQPILMLTAKGSENDVVHGFSMGADDYVCKPFSLRELLMRVQALLRRTGKIKENKILEIDGLSFDSGKLTVANEKKETAITRRELELVEFLNNNRERIVPRSELLVEVWNYADGDMETRTVDIHIQKLRKKITDLGYENEFITTIRGEGYRLAERK